MKQRLLLLATAVCLPVFSLLAPASVASAQAAGNTTGQALEIAPPIITLSANPGQTVKAEISLRNISNGNLLVKSQINDFEAAGEDGTPKIIFDDKATEPNPRSIKQWVSPLANLIAAPRQIKKLPLAITVPANASPGGYYGVVRFTATPPELDGTGVSLSASIGSLVLLTVNGQAKEGMSIKQFTVEKDGNSGSLFESTPLNFVLRMQNDGNLHEQPVGQGEMTDMFGKKVAILNFNQPPRNVLPGSIRRFESPLDQSVIGNKVLFGRYTVNLKMTYGASKIPVTSTLTFWIIPYRLMGLAIAVLVIAFFALRFGIRRYNQSIINRAQGGNAKKSKGSKKK